MFLFSDSANPWLSTPVLSPDDPGAMGGGRLAPGLIAAVAGIVAIAAGKARAAGEANALRQAIEAALGPAHEGGDAGAPRRGDAAQPADRTGT